MATLNPGQTATITNNSRTTKGVSVRVNLVSNVVNTPQVLADFDASKIFVRITAKRNGMEHNVYSGNLQTITAGSTIGSASFAMANRSATGNLGIQLLASGVAAAEIRLLPLYIDFGSICDGKLGEISCTLQSTSNEYSSATNSNSSIMFDFEEANGTEFYLPTIRVHSVNENESAKEYPLGSMVRRVVFLNTDKATKTTADNVLTMANFTCEEFMTSDNWNALQSKMSTQMSLDDFTNVLQSAVLVDSDEIPGTDGVINCIFNSTNVSGGANFILAWGGIITRSAQASSDDYARKISKPFIKAEVSAPRPISGGSSSQVARVQRSVVSSSASE